MALAEAPREGAMPAVSQEAVFADSIRALQKPVRTSSLSAVAVAALLAIVLSQHYAWREIAVWCAGVLVVQYGLAARGLPWSPRGDVRAGATKWARFYLFNGIALSLYWGLSLLYFVDPARPQIQFFIALALGGIAAGSTAIQSFYPPMMMSYLVCLILPFSVRMLAIGDLDHAYLGAGMLLLTTYLLYYGYVHSRTLRRAIVLRHENAALVQQLSEKALALEAASQAKSQFFAAASHDLRQPLHALSYYASLLKPHEADAPHVERIEQCIGSLDDLLEGVLDISRLDSGRVTPHAAPLDVDAMLQRLASLYDGSAAARGLRIRVHGAGQWVTSDAALLERVVSNLLSNALRYTARGGVLMAARRRADQLRLQVIDTGIGIAADQQERIFDEFVQLQNAQRDPAKGVGLGLATVKRLCALLGHPIAVRSQPGRGSVFELRLPVTPPPTTLAQAMPEVAQARMGQARILVVEDHELVRESLVETLRAWELECDSAQDGARALELAAEHEYDAVLCDWRLPNGLDGVQVLERIRTLQPRLALAALLTGETASSLGTLPLDIALLRKPVRPIRLRALLSAHLARGA